MKTIQDHPNIARKSLGIQRAGGRLNWEVNNKTSKDDHNGIILKCDSGVHSLRIGTETN